MASRIVIHLGLAVVMLVSAAAAEWRSLGDAGCALSDGETGTVAAVHDGTTLQLADGMVVRLAAIAVPGALDGGADPQQAADAMARQLSELVAGRTVTLRYGAVSRDRYDRALAHVFVSSAGGEAWVQAALIDAGVAQVAGFADDRSCLGQLLDHEGAARRSFAGLWRERHYRPSWAGDPSLRLADGLYGQVEGRVESVGSTERTIFLNFGRDWSHDLTVMVRVGDAEKAGVGVDAFTALTHRRVRVRGWVTQRDGPLIRVDHPEQIEVLEDGNDGAETDDRPDR